MLRIVQIHTLSLVLEFSGEESMSVLLALIIYISVYSGPDTWLHILYMNKPLFRPLIIIL